jgi:hypothetical protein
MGFRVLGISFASARRHVISRQGIVYLGWFEERHVVCHLLQASLADVGLVSERRESLTIARNRRLKVKLNLF